MKPKRFLFLISELAAEIFLLASLCGAAPAILLSSPTVLPGGTLRVELDGVSPDARVKALFQNKSYRFFAVGPNAQRALIGVKLGSLPGRFPLTVVSLAPGAQNPEVPAPAEVTIASRTYTIDAITFNAGKTSLMRWEHRESVLIHRAALQTTADQYWEGVFSPPLSGPLIGEFGLHRIRNGTIDAGFHKGVDLRAAAGTPVLASNAGVVVIARTLKAHGKIVLLDHGQGVMTIYLHLSSILVKPGQKVAHGQILGRVGSTGLSTAPHIHWEVFVHSVPVDPQPWMETEF